FQPSAEDSAELSLEPIGEFVAHRQRLLVMGNGLAAERLQQAALMHVEGGRAILPAVEGSRDAVEIPMIHQGEAGDDAGTLAVGRLLEAIFRICPIQPPI